MGEGEGERGSGTDCVLWEGYILGDLTDFRSLIIQTFPPEACVKSMHAWTQSQAVRFSVTSSSAQGLAPELPAQEATMDVGLSQ